MSWELIWGIISGDDADFEDDTKDDNRFVTRALRNAATWPLFSLVLGVTVAAMILRLRDPAISVWYSAMCTWTGVLVLIVPLVLFDELKRFLCASRPLHLSALPALPTTKSLVLS
jgi:hypothetical protein